MNIVFVRHQGDRRPYLFAVPEGVTLAKGAEVVCDTCKGETTGKCFTPSVDMSRSAVEYFGPLLGASFPLKSVVGEVRHQVVRFPAKEDKPAEKTEPVKLYCVKSYKPGEWCTKGKIYELSADGTIAMDDGWVEIYDDKCLGGRPFRSYFVPLVKRPAKIGEYIIVTARNAPSAYDHRYDLHDILKVTQDDSNIIKQWKGKAVAFQNVTHPDRPWQMCVIKHSDYFVIDGYKGDGE